MNTKIIAISVNSAVYKQGMGGYISIHRNWGPRFDENGEKIPNCVFYRFDCGSKEHQRRRYARAQRMMKAFLKGGKK